MGDDLNDLIEENRISLAEVDDALCSDPANEDLLQVREDLQAARTELLATVKTQGPCEGSGQVASSTQSEPTHKSSASVLHDNHAARSSMGAYPGPVGPLLHPVALCKPAHEEPDFLALASKYADLAPHVRVGQHGRGAIDFTNFEAARQLTRALLAEDYGVSWWVPDGHLIPPVTNRANYIHWLHDLLDLCSDRESVRVLDIGCGANLIYPLLGAAMHGWHFVGADITDTAIKWAKKNAAANTHLQHLIEIRRVLSEGLESGLLTPAFQEGEAFTFTMCNPPFFESMEEAGQNPATAFSGTAAEMVCPGGELAFVTRMVTDSLQLKDRVAWFTTMVGKKETLKRVRAMLHALSVPSVRSTQFTQGRTHRWGLAWSFRVPQLAASKQPGLAPTVARSKLTFSLPYPKGDPSKLLSLLTSTVEAHGGVVEQQPQAFLLRARFEPQQTARIGSSNSAEAQAERQQAIVPGSNESGESGNVNGPEMPSAGIAKQLKPDVMQRSAKRQRTGEKVEEESFEGVTQRQVEFEMTMTLRQESVGSFAVLASLQQDRLQGVDAARGFTQKCHAIQQDIKQLLMGM